MTLLRVDSSIRTDGSVSRGVADVLEEAWSRHHTGPVVRRDLGRDPLPAQAWATAEPSDGQRRPQGAGSPQRGQRAPRRKRSSPRHAQHSGCPAATTAPHAQHAGGARAAPRPASR